MKRFLVALSLLTAAMCVSPRAAEAQAAWTSPVFNWGSGWCPTCYVFANVDTPNLTTPFAGTISGWAFECASGQPIDKIDVYYGSATEFHRADTYLAALHVDRPDVLAYFLPLCARVSSTTGWSVGFHTPLPSGTWRVSVVVWKGMVSTTQAGLVIVP